MPRRFNAVFRRFLPALAAASAMACAQAVELGDVSVRSWIGQPLVADIELTGFSGEAGAVAVKLARNEVFEGASIAVHPALANARMSVMQRDGRQFLHLTSVTPVNTPYLHLFLELTDGDRKNVRAATLSLSPDPSPAPAPKPAPAPAPESRPPAPPIAPVQSKPAPPPLPLKARVTQPAPALRAPVAPAPVAACPKPRYTDDQIRACAASEYRSALLSAQIVELEEKVKGLQAALDAPLPLPLPPAVRPAKVVALPVPPVVSPPPAPADGLPLAWIGAAVAAVVAAGVGMLAYRRRKTPQPAPPVPAPRRTPALLARLRDALQRDRKPAGPESGSRTEPE